MMARFVCFLFFLFCFVSFFFFFFFFQAEDGIRDRDVTGVQTCALPICVLLSAHNISFAHVLGLLAALGFAAGFFAVPVNALIQHRPDERGKGGIIDRKSVV